MDGEQEIKNLLVELREGRERWKDIQKMIPRPNPDTSLGSLSEQERTTLTSRAPSPLTLSLWRSYFEIRKSYFASEGQQKGQDQLRVIANEFKIRLNTLERLKRCFECFDLDRSGELEEEESTDLLKILLSKIRKGEGEGGRETEVAPSGKKLKEIWSCMDSNKDGSVDFPEFVKWFLKFFRAHGGKEHEIKNLEKKVMEERAHMKRTPNSLHRRGPQRVDRGKKEKRRRS